MPANRAPRPALLLDITRSVARSGLSRPTGIDRVERAYLDWALTRPGGVWLTARLGPEGQGGRVYLIPPDNAEDVARRIGPGHRTTGPIDWRGRLEIWQPPVLRTAETAIRRASIATCRLAEPALRPILAQAFPAGGTWLNVGHENIAAPLLAALRGVGVRSFVMIHDLIPITHPQFARQDAARRFRARLEAALGADRHLYNSHATGQAVDQYAAEERRERPLGDVLPLGISPLSSPPPPPTQQKTVEKVPVPPAGHFVQLGTIEGRKNHALTLAIWRELNEAEPRDRAPHLHIVGRRGWAAERVAAMLDHEPMIGRTVFEHASLDDEAVAKLLVSARALLMPSFAEGYGLPVAEALAARVPVIASDLPALREVGGAAPEWLDPHDPQAWRAAIRDYARPHSPRRDAQIARLAAWQPPNWHTHFTRLEEALEWV
ncbi:MAG: glycosyltransferase [Pseudomonadota bacterium]